MLVHPNKTKLTVTSAFIHHFKFKYYLESLKPTVTKSFYKLHSFSNIYIQDIFYSVQSDFIKPPGNRNILRIRYNG